MKKSRKRSFVSLSTFYTIFANVEAKQFSIDSHFGSSCEHNKELFVSMARQCSFLYRDIAPRNSFSSELVVADYICQFEFSTYIYLELIDNAMD